MKRIKIILNGIESDNIIAFFSSFQSDIKILHGGKILNGKSIMNIPYIEDSDQLDVMVSGEDETMVIENIKQKYKYQMN